jgi:hypothetical protein
MRVRLRDFSRIDLLLNLLLQDLELLRGCSHIDNVQHIAPTAPKSDVTVNLHPDPATVRTTNTSAHPMSPIPPVLKDSQAARSQYMFHLSHVRNSTFSL